MAVIAEIAQYGRRRPMIGREEPGHSLVFDVNALVRSLAHHRSPNSGWMFLGDDNGSRSVACLATRTGSMICDRGTVSDFCHAALNVGRRDTRVVLTVIECGKSRFGVVSQADPGRHRHQPVRNFQGLPTEEARAAATPILSYLDE
jgi:hypothetical protein